MDSNEMIEDLEHTVESLRAVASMLRSDNARKAATINDLRAEINELWEADRQAQAWAELDQEPQYAAADAQTEIEEGLAASVHDQAAALHRFAQAAYDAGTEPAYHSFDVVSIATALVAARVSGEIAGGLVQ